MRRSASFPNGKLISLAILSVQAAGCQAPEDRQALAPLWVVHIDAVRPSMEAEFTRLNAAENQQLHAILREHGQSIQPVYVIATSGGIFMSLRPKQSFTDFDTPSAVPESVSKLFPAVTDPLDEPIHAALEHHHNEIWRYRESGSYIPATPARRSTPGYIQLVSEQVIPRMAGRYEQLMESVNSALRQSSYPGDVLMFSSSYGDGCFKFLWQADSKEQFLQAGDRAAVLAAVYGQEAADRMLADLQSCLASSETTDAAPRRDFTDLDESVDWLGQPPR